MENTPINDAIETALSGAEIFVRDIKITSIQQLKRELKKLEEEDDGRFNGN